VAGEPTPEGNGHIIRYRLGELQTDVDFLTKRVSGDHSMVNRHDEQINGEGGLNKRVGALTQEVNGMRRALIGFALGLPIAGITFLLGVLALVRP
jgi:hypothetical protein